MVNLLVFSIAWSNNLISSIVQITLLNGKRLRESSVSCPRTQQNNPDSTDKPILINCIVQHDNLIKSLLKVIPWKFCATDICALTVLHFYLKVLKAVDELNKDSTIHGIIVQLPPDSEEPIDPAICTNAVAPEKDVDGYGFIYTVPVHASIGFC